MIPEGKREERQSWTAILFCASKMPSCWGLPLFLKPKIKRHLSAISEFNKLFCQQMPLSLLPSYSSLCAGKREDSNKRRIEEEQKQTRPNTRPSVADGWAGAEMRVFPLFDLMVTDRWTKPLIELRVRN